MPKEYTQNIPVSAEEINKLYEPRNFKIVELHDQGFSFRHIANYFKISFQRAHEIYHDHKDRYYKQLNKQKGGEQE